MGTVLASTVIASASEILLDSSNARWSTTDHLRYLNDGQYELVVLKPTASVTISAVQCVAGAKQALPADGLALLDVPRNMGTDGLTPGRAIKIIPRELLDSFNPNWYVGTASATVKHYIYSPLSPKVWYCFPPQPASGFGYVEMVYASVPATIATTVGTITVDNIFSPALVYYCVYRALQRDAEYAGNSAEAMRYYGMFSAIVQGKAAGELALSPTHGLGQANPADPASTK